MHRRIGFPIAGFHGDGNGMVTELEEILAATADHQFTVEKMWIPIELHRSLTEAILAPISKEQKEKAHDAVKQGFVSPGPIAWFYRFADKSIPFFIDPDIRADRLVLEGEQA